MVCKNNVAFAPPFIQEGSRVFIEVFFSGAVLNVVSSYSAMEPSLKATVYKGDDHMLGDQ